MLFLEKHSCLQVESGGTGGSPPAVREIVPNFCLVDVAFGPICSENRSHFLVPSFGGFPPRRLLLGSELNKRVFDQTINDVGDAAFQVHRVEVQPPAVHLQELFAHIHYEFYSDFFHLLIVLFDLLNCIDHFLGNFLAKVIHFKEKLIGVDGHDPGQNRTIYSIGSAGGHELLKCLEVKEELSNDEVCTGFHFLFKV